MFDRDVDHRLRRDAFAPDRRGRSPSDRVREERSDRREIDRPDLLRGVPHGVDRRGSRRGRESPNGGKPLDREREGCGLRRVAEHRPGPVASDHPRDDPLVAEKGEVNHVRFRKRVGPGVQRPVDLVAHLDLRHHLPRPVLESHRGIVPDAVSACQRNGTSGDKRRQAATRDERLPQASGNGPRSDEREVGHSDPATRGPMRP